MRKFALSTARYFAILMFLVWSAGPILFIIISSLKPQTEMFAYPPSLIFQPTFEHYVTLWNEWDAFFATMRNSLIVAVGATLLAVFVSFLGGYVYSRYSGRLLGASAIYMIAIRLLPPIVVTLPLFPIVDALGLSDTHIILILLYAAFWVSLCTMIIKTFIDEVPRELDEAAFVDGASQLQTIARVIFPLARQGIMASAIFVFVFSWNEYLFALIFTTQHAKTAPLVISEVMDAIYGTDWGVLFAGVTVQLLPVVLLVMLAQRLLVAGLTAGSVKG
ncbi:MULTISPECIES: carbohydrate ABC transporter permease [unclassified Chelatococcus]|uniref:carbohydrate ABC transporter permease n=1 Tax=unclassified Chelatococcus TaxID=2638111 RepID=UPI001BD05E79|nr:MULTISPECIES: carbohydrate ABC transporter permease [unclassified Chelatococcus]MBS7699682.1 carbohydrate ABC transporter permease [Chelatococcus sp. YT9]MBX3557120.1 carbohydrate ABC transporter permease [Chelatococcus sp.]